MEYISADEVVWAKVKGHPWWPAVVLSTNDCKHKRYRVNFIGDATQ